MPWNGEPQSQDVIPPTASIRIVSLKGRIGRLRMIAYPLGLGILITPPVLFLVSVVEPDSNAAALGLALFGLSYLVMNGIWTVRRVQDFNGPMWVSAIFILTMIFVPIVNFLLWFIPGAKDENRYGPPPPPNSAGVGILAFLTPTIFIVGILAAVIIPAYHDYKVKANVHKDASISNAYRAALQISCAKGPFRPGLPDVYRTLGDPQQYTGEFVESIIVVDLSQQVAEITVTYRAIGNAITAGQTVIFIGTCRDTVVDWEVAGTVAEKFRPRI